MLFSMLAKFPDIEHYNAALAFLKKNTRAPYSIYRDLSQQALLESGTRLFGSMSFPELRRLSFDLETRTTPGYDFPNADRPGDEIIIISLRDSTGWETVLSQETMNEKELIETFLKVVAERDPDVIEGHNICRFDLPYLETPRQTVQAKAHPRPRRLRAPETPQPLHHRRAADQLHPLRILRQAHHRHVASCDVLRHVEPQIWSPTTSSTSRATSRSPPATAPIWTGGKFPTPETNDRQKLLAYALDDVRECEALSALLSPSYFLPDPESCR